MLCSAFAKFLSLCPAIAKVSKSIPLPVINVIILKARFLQRLVEMP
jgi:hypothetical protein